jgi:hypothetical protein
MNKHIYSGVVLTMALVSVAPAAAQDAAKPIDLSDLRHHIYVMEGALARAVNLGASR